MVSDETLKKIREDLNRAEKIIKEQEADIRKAEDAGIDVKEEKTKLREQQASVRKISAAYFPTK